MLRGQFLSLRKNGTYTLGKQSLQHVPKCVPSFKQSKRVNLLQNKQTFESHFHCTVVPQVKEKYLHILSILMTPIKSLVPWNVHVSHVHLNNGTFQKISYPPTSLPHDHHLLRVVSVIWAVGIFFQRSQQNFGFLGCNLRRC